MLRQEIIKLIAKSIKELQKEKKFSKFDIGKIQVEHPENKVYGDYAANIAMAVAKIEKKNPMEVAEIISEKLKAKSEKLFEKIEVAKPGFINFFISKKYLQNQLGEILEQKESFGSVRIGRGQKVNIEFISANPTGELHIGHGRGAFFGDCLANVLKKTGYKVVREYLVNDAKNSAQIKELGKTALGRGTTYFNNYLKGKISELKSQISRLRPASAGAAAGKQGHSTLRVLGAMSFGGQAKPSEGEAGYLLAQEIQKDIKNFIDKKLKIKFNVWTSEENLYRQNKVDGVYHLLKNKKLIYEKEKAEWLKTSEFGDSKDWVIIRATGEPTYLLSDIAYHKDKFNRGFDKIINIWGADHQGHVGKIEAVARILDYKGNLDVLISQVVRLKGGKISKRKGEVVALEWLLEEVGLDATRFFYLAKSLDTQMEFDVGLAKEKTAKSPVFYIQYAFVRASSIIQKYDTEKNGKKRKVSAVIQPSLYKFIIHQTELELIKLLIRFPEIIEDTSKDYQV